MAELFGLLSRQEKTTALLTTRAFIGRKYFTVKTAPSFSGMFSPAVLFGLSERPEEAASTLLAYLRPGRKDFPFHTAISAFLFRSHIMAKLFGLFTRREKTTALLATLAFIGRKYVTFTAAPTFFGMFSPAVLFGLSERPEKAASTLLAFLRAGRKDFPFHTAISAFLFRSHTMAELFGLFTRREKTTALLATLAFIGRKYVTFTAAPTFFGMFSPTMFFSLFWRPEESASPLSALVYSGREDSPIQTAISAFLCLWTAIGFCFFPCIEETPPLVLALDGSSHEYVAVLAAPPLVRFNSLGFC
jgi:hypothetical protein